MVEGDAVTPITEEEEEEKRHMQLST